MNMSHRYLYVDVCVTALTATDNLYADTIYWGLHLIWVVTFTKIIIFYVRNGLKFDF